MRRDKTLTIEGITLRETCYACPEQYDAFDSSGRRVGYLRLRHGHFTVHCPYVEGPRIYAAEPSGDGRFESGERQQYLESAVKAIKEWMTASSILKPKCRYICV